ncbi:MAG: hypothetical protein LBN28_03665 [Desulfovibrio sp.]|nr:hypothetical protein [Desulfovibrio sp.]
MNAVLLYGVAYIFVSCRRQKDLPVCDRRRAELNIHQSLFAGKSVKNVEKLAQQPDYLERIFKHTG